MSEKQDNNKGHVDSLHQVPMSDHATHPEQDSAWEERLHPHWEHLDEWSDRHSPHPSAAHIQQVLLQAKKRNRRRLWKELLVLWSAALLLVGGGCSLAQANWYIYVWMQLISLCVAVLIWAICIHPSNGSEQNE
ncbi:hypothetical protein AZ66_12695 [Paenibacillus sp. E194]|uniref:YxlC family protein n=1 Tax=Paenibacillus sp. E194 TaxID=1458845 RepID=UPI0005C9B45D|nr:YxlC family protein [Paenibacillus sp. E194]KJB87491.1 hypothetical protein AZ66_12695 [Paenibacillus sp. E194]